jgi:hypothetical protein
MNVFIHVLSFANLLATVLRLSLLRGRLSVARIVFSEL